MRQALAEQLPSERMEMTPASTEATTTAAFAERLRLYAVPDPEPAAEAFRAYAPQEMAFEAEAVAEHERWLGSVALQAEGVAEPGETFAEVNFNERLRAAKAGDPEALRWIDINIATATSEAVFKEHVGATYMDRSRDGGLEQFGQTNDDIHRNALLRPGRHPVLQGITEAEALNRQRIEKAVEAGALQDNWYAVFSLVPEGVPENDLGAGGDGYFVSSLTLNIQATTELPDGRVKTETAFTPGVEADDDDSFEELLDKRHDFAAVQKLYEWLGQEAPDTAAGLLRQGLFIPKDIMPNGVVELRYWFDLAKDEVLGRQTDRRLEDYLGLWLESKRKEASLADVRRKVRDDLFLAADDLGPDPTEGTQKLWDRVRIHATADAQTNPHINPRVFGKAAAASIRKARHYLSKGDTRTAEEYMERALADAEITGCGGGSGGSKAAKREGEDLSQIAGEDELGARAFRCPECGSINVRPFGELIASCGNKDCGADVSC